MGRLKVFIAILLLPVVMFASIGKISALNGDVSITRDSKVVKAVAGTTLEQKDIVKSSKGSTAQIVFNDNTVITVGSATTFKVEEYLFDEKTPNAKFKVEEGSFKTITGKIGKIAPDKFKLETKTATIGIRGTVFVGKIDGEGNLKIACTKGAIVVTPNLPNIPNTPPPPPTLVPEGQMTNADKKGVEPPRTYTPGDLKDLGGDLGGYAKRGGSNNQGNGNQDNKDKPTFAANDVKEKVGDSTNQIINTIVNNQTSGGSAWAAAYGEDYDKNYKYFLSGKMTVFYASKSDYDAQAGGFGYSSFQGQYFEIHPKDGAVSVQSSFTGLDMSGKANVTGEDSFSFKLSGDVDGSSVNSANSKLYTTADSAGTDYASWGYWVAEYEYSGTQVVFGTWVGGALTNPSEISSLVSSNAVVNYKGQSIGGVVNHDGYYSAIKMDSNNAVNLTINFGATNSINGSINFDAGASEWRVNIAAGQYSSQITPSSSSFRVFSDGSSPFSGTGSNSSMVTSGSLEGRFYGPNANTIGGAFKFQTMGSAKAAGVFKANKQ